MISTAVIMSALELGCIYALVALALFLSFRVLNIADMTTDGAFTLGCAVSATFAVAGHPILGLPAAMLAGACAGSITAFLQTKLQIPSILAGIITNTGLYTVNLAVMGFSSNVNMMRATTVFSLVQPYLGKTLGKVIPVALVTLCVGALLAIFLKTRIGLSIRATGDNPDMVRASSINTGFTITIGLCISNSLTALSGAMLAQYQKTADINLGSGMVVIGLASLIIGETLLPKGKTWVKILGAILGSVVYRFIIAIALRFDLPSECLKLISATIVALALFLSFRVLHIADMTTDGAFTLGCAVSATFAVAGHPILGLPAAMLAGACAGSITAFLQTKLQIPSILAGIITNTGLYTVNLAVMGFSSNVNMMRATTVFSLVQPYLGKTLGKVIPVAQVTLCVGALLAIFLKTRIGLSIRATGDNPDMVRASSINTGFTITIGLCISNSLTALSGAMLAQYQKTADINLGSGMVVIGLASLIIGETLLPKGKTWVKILGAILGSVVYRFIIAIALRFDLPSECLKLISATIVALAIGLPAIKAGLKPATTKGGK